MKPKMLHIQFLHLIEVIALTIVLLLSCWDGFDGAYNERWEFGPLKIAFTRGGNIYTIDADGNNLSRLTYGTATNEYPSWSGDGSRIAFHSERDGSREIYVMKYDGTMQTRLTYNTLEDYYPSFSPDGNRIVFMRGMLSGFLQLFLISPEGGDEEQITFTAGDNDHPKWSPDGSRIVFSSNRSGNYDIWVINIDDLANPLQLTSDAAIDNWPNWSADGSTIIFRKNNSDLYSIKVDGSDNYSASFFVSTGEFNDSSPDGATVLFTRSSGPDIYFINPDGTGERLFLSNGNNPCWSPF